MIEKLGDKFEEVSKKAEQKDKDVGDGKDRMIRILIPKIQYPNNWSFKKRNLERRFEKK